jgi:hypothetical protein
MLTTSKKSKLLNALKSYNKKYLHSKITELDESGTRILVNTFLTEVLGYVPIEDVKTEYMIRGTYADYVIQLKEDRQFLVEVKSLSYTLSEKHLRQAINYGANEGIEWALLTNGKYFAFYKIIFDKPIDSRKVFSLDLSDSSQFKNCVEILQYIHKEAILKKGLNILWNKTCALDPLNVAGLLLAPPVTNFIKRTLKKKFKSKFSDDEIHASINRIIHEPIDLEDVKHTKIVKRKRKSEKENVVKPKLTILEPKPIENSEETAIQAN